MKIAKTLSLCAAAVASVFMLAPAAYADFPERPITIIVPYPAGAGTDVSFRQIAQRMEQELGQPIMIDNKPGASALIGHSAGARAKPDGYTLTLVSTSLASNPATLEDPKVRFSEDFEPIGLFSSFALLGIVSADSPIQNFQDAIDKAKASPRGVTFGTSTGYLLFAKRLVEAKAGVEFLDVAYKGTPEIIIGVMSKTLDIGLASASQITEGMRPIFFLGSERSRAFPDVPTVAELYPGASLVGWNGLVAPKGTPSAVIERVSQAMDVAMDDPQVREFLAKAFNDIIEDGSPEHMSKVVLEDEELYKTLAEGLAKSK